MGDGGGLAHVENDPRRDPSAEAPDPEQAAKLGGDNFQVGWPPNGACLSSCGCILFFAQPNIRLWQ